MMAQKKIETYWGICLSSLNDIFFKKTGSANFEQEIPCGYKIGYRFYPVLCFMKQHKKIESGVFF